ncbi:hypothetical protein D5S17_20310 [Pseudonocardiaceae bacterium YIM PH 21723]|nr:hypothetical protein D5S17_20310 [Pseudonocardiaceae bacterium YIM PH 21723]
MTRLRGLFAGLLGACLLASGLLAPAATAAEARADKPRLCLRGHVQNLGWQSWGCDDGRWAYAGTEGRGLRLEALQITMSNTGGTVCVQAHVQNLGWMEQQCGGDGKTITVGTTGQNLGLEAIAFGHMSQMSCGEGHVQNIGWQPRKCVDPEGAWMAGTTGRGLSLEAVRAGIR